MSLRVDFSDKVILCLGDVMLDHFVYGNVERVSPESPIPILHTSRSFSMIGGAGNVARNVAALGGKVIFIGLVGEDRAADEMTEAFRIHSSIQHFLIQEKQRRTIQKTRFIAQNQQLLRVDDEVIIPCTTATEAKILSICTDLKSSCHGVILSDYSKGFFGHTFTQQLIKLFQRECPIVVDPKGWDYTKYKGATLLTPNLKELGDVCGKKFTEQRSITEAAQELRKTCEIEAILVTQGAQGMALIDDSKESFHIPAIAREIYDVSGAGDTVIATMGLCLASEKSLKESCRLANTAAGIVVGKVGTATVSADELEKALIHQGLETQTKILHLAQATDQLKEWRRLGYTVGFTNGCFDLLHLGHLHVLKTSAAACDKLIVGLNSDASVKRLKGETRPIHDQQTRAEILSSLEVVDLVIIFDEDTPEQLIEVLLPDVLIKGGDYTIEKIVGAACVTAHGGKVLIVDLKPGNSTTSTVEKITQKDI